MPPLLGLHAFEASARHLSFAAAAAELHLSPAAVSQRVRTLEAHLGVPLFIRRPRSLRLTESGEAYLPALREIFEDLSDATASIFGRPDRVGLTVRVQASYGATWLAPRLAGFHRDFPAIEVRVTSAIWSASLPPAQIDLEVRQGTGSWPGYRAVKLHDDDAVAVCAPGHSARSVQELRSRPRVQILGFERLWSYLFPATDELREPGQGTPAAMTVDTAISAIEVVASSDLWAIVPERFARAGVRSGRLTVVPESLVSMRQAHYLLRRDNADQVSSESLVFERWLRAEDDNDVPLSARADGELVRRDTEPALGSLP